MNNHPFATHPFELAVNPSCGTNDVVNVYCPKYFLGNSTRRTQSPNLQQRLDAAGCDQATPKLPPEYEYLVPGKETKARVQGK